MERELREMEDWLGDIYSSGKRPGAETKQRSGEGEAGGVLRSESKAPLMTPWALQTPRLLRSQYLSQCVVISCFFVYSFLEGRKCLSFFFNNILLFDLRASQVVAQTVKNLPAKQETQV